LPSLPAPLILLPATLATAHLKRQFGKVDIPQEAFIAALKVDS
jgi:translation elongation factor EF-4